MVVEIFAIYDRIARVFDPPFVSVNSLTAQRSVKALLAQSNNYSSNPGDYELFCIGQYESSEGVISSVDKPRKIISLTDLVEVKNAS